ncbi:hypothetical protein ABZ769_11065 [Streptomyces olivoreticuli]
MTDHRDPAASPETGSLVVDTQTDRVGIVMGHEGPYIQLRPPGGGTEWDVPPDKLRPAEPTDELRAKVAVVNKRDHSRWS